MVLGLRDAASLRWTLIMMTTVDGCGWHLSLTKTNTGREGERCNVLMGIHVKSHSCTMQKGQESSAVLGHPRLFGRPHGTRDHPCQSKEA